MEIELLSRSVALCFSPRSRRFFLSEFPLRTLKTIQTLDESEELRVESEDFVGLRSCALLFFCQIYQLVLRLAPAIFTWLSVSGLRSQAFHSSFLIPNSSFPPSARPKDSYAASPLRTSLPRKEVIQPHLPIRLPCYDFTPVIGLTFGSWLRFRLPH